MLDIDLTCGYKIKSLTFHSKQSVGELCKKCSDYYILSDGVLPSEEEIYNIFTELPENKNLEDKFLLGVYNSNHLVGIVDIIRDFPVVGEWMLGLMLIVPEERGNRLGRILHEALVKWAKGLGAKTFRIGVIEDNSRALNFWSKLGYTSIKEVNMNFKLKTHVINVMRLQI